MRTKEQGEMVTQDKTIREMLGVYELFRRFGFANHEIHFLISREGCFCELKAQEKEYNVKCGAVSDIEAFEKEMLEVMHAVNDGTFPDNEFHRIVAESAAFAAGAIIITSLLKKGFVLPNYDGLGRKVVS
jgi:hypothetical protein